MKMKELLNEQRIISPLTWNSFLSIIRYISENKQVQEIIEQDPKFATQLRRYIQKMEDDFKQ